MRRDRCERGVTLVELIVVVSVLGMLVAAISSAMFVGSKALMDPDDGAMARSASAVDAYLASTTFPADVMSTNYQVWVPSAGSPKYNCQGQRRDIRPGLEKARVEPAPCPAPNPQENLVVFEIRTRGDEQYSSLIAYRAEQSGDSWRLVRARYDKVKVPIDDCLQPTYVGAEGEIGTECGRGPITYGTPTERTVATGLAEKPHLSCSGKVFFYPGGVPAGQSHWKPCDDPKFVAEPVLATVRLVLAGSDGTKTVLIAERRVKDPQ